MSLRALLADEARYARATRDPSERNALMRYAYARGVTIRDLSAATGLSSTSTVYEIVRGTERAKVNWLDGPAPTHTDLEPYRQPK